MAGPVVNKEFLFMPSPFIGDDKRTKEFPFVVLVSTSEIRMKSGSFKVYQAKAHISLIPYFKLLPVLKNPT
jgi:hypothetical protein